MAKHPLAKARKLLKWSQPELAAHAGENTSLIFDIENRRSRHTAYPRVVRILRALTCGGLPEQVAASIFPVEDPPICKEGKPPVASDRRSGRDRRAA
jgi:transcriptional regulator with XRE-family HTH domain